MGKRGPKPKPSALRVFEGNPGHKPISKNEPKPKGKSKAPRWLNDGAKKVWVEVAPKLEAIGLLTDVDARAFANYCRLASMAQIAYDERDLNLWLRLIAEQRKHGADFGMSPASRVGLKVDGDARQADELDEFKRSG